MIPIALSQMDLILLLLQVVLSLIPAATGLYFAWAFLRAPFRKAVSADGFRPRHRILVLVPARNEQNVIRNVLSSLAAVRYPRDLLDVRVLADNCTDNTAAIAEAAGFQVLERHDLSSQTKAGALRWAFEDMGLLHAGYDAISIIDADNTVDPDFFLQADRKLQEGADVVQGRRDAMNPGDSALSAMMDIMTAMENRLVNVPLENRGRSYFIYGTGNVIRCSHLLRVGWKIRTLAEDAEFTVHTALAGGKVLYCDDARCQAEMASSFPMLWRQQRRWVSGQLECLRTYLPAIVQRAKADRGGPALSLLMSLTIPFTCMVGLIQAFLGPLTSWMVFGSLLSAEWILGCLAVNQLAGMCVGAAILALDGRLRSGSIRGIVLFPWAYALFGMIGILSLFRPQRTWKPVAHGLQSPQPD